MTQLLNYICATSILLNLMLIGFIVRFYYEGKMYQEEAERIHKRLVVTKEGLREEEINNHEKYYH